MLPETFEHEVHGAGICRRVQVPLKLAWALTVRAPLRRLALSSDAMPSLMLILRSPARSTSAKASRWTLPACV